MFLLTFILDISGKVRTKVIKDILLNKYPNLLILYRRGTTGAAISNTYFLKHKTAKSKCFCRLCVIRSMALILDIVHPTELF
jgi:hypothetical protein